MNTQETMTVWNKPLTTASGLPDAARYQMPVRTIPGYTGKRGTKHSCLSSLANVRIVRAAFPEYSRVDHARRAMELRALADAAGKDWSARWDAAFKARYGRAPEFYNYRISGVGDDGLAGTDKDELRRLAVLRGQASSLASLHRDAAGVVAMRAEERRTA